MRPGVSELRSADCRANPSHGRSLSVHFQWCLDSLPWKALFPVHTSVLVRCAATLRMDCCSQSLTDVGHAKWQPGSVCCGSDWLRPCVSSLPLSDKMHFVSVTPVHLNSNLFEGRKKFQMCMEQGFPTQFPHSFIFCSNAAFSGLNPVMPI